MNDRGGSRIRVSTRTPSRRDERGGRGGEREREEESKSREWRRYNSSDRRSFSASRSPSDILIPSPQVRVFNVNRIPFFQMLFRDARKERTKGEGREEREEEKKEKNISIRSTPTCPEATYSTEGVDKKDAYLAEV